MKENDVLTRIKKTLVKELNLEISPSKIGDDERLYSSSIRLDSLGLLRVILAMETEFEQKIDDEDVMDANLETVASLASLLKKNVS